MVAMERLELVLLAPLKSPVAVAQVEAELAELAVAAAAAAAAVAAVVIMNS